MKIVKLFPALLLAGCMAPRKNVYVQPEKYSCDLIIPTIWDGSHPVTYFEHEMLLDTPYYDYMGQEYRLVATDVPGVFAIKVSVPKP